MACKPTEAIVLSSDDEEAEETDDGFAALGEDRPPSDEDYYSSSVTLSSESEDENEDNEDVAAIDEASENPSRINSAQPIEKSEGDQIDAMKELPSDHTAESNEQQQPKRKKSKTSPEKKQNGKSKRSSKKKGEKKKNNMRKNIRQIKADEKLDESTINAQKEEEERKQRLAERVQNLQQEAATSSVLRATLNESPVNATTPPTKPDVVELLSSEDEDDDDCVIVEQDTSKDDSKIDEDDPENSGIHVDDSLNKPDSIGRVLVNVSHPTTDQDVFLAPQIARIIKPHQIGGMRFLYDNIVESLDRFRASPGFGCILAHSMGLGKTLQIVGFTDVFMRYTKAKRVLIIVPINTLQNWLNEFDMWLPCQENIGHIPADEVLPRSFKLHVINDLHKTVEARAKVIDAWTSLGGVLLMGYEMFRLLSTCKTRKRKRKANAAPEVIDIDQEERDDGLKTDMQQALLDPGPDLVICDEGHRIKNSLAGISKSLKAIKTKRRVVLTGYPLQNNLIEYWCMVDFVRPNFLGSRTEFSNMFERPITNGQCLDSTPQDVKLMRYRAHVLHSLLEGFVQRRNHRVLQKNLPPKQEWVLMIRMSEFQKKIYKLFMDDLKREGDSCIGGTNPLKAFAVACKIWNHPDVMYKFLNKQADRDFELEPSSDSPKPASGAKRMRKSASESVLNKKQVAVPSASTDSLFGLLDQRSAEITYDWVKPAFDDYVPQIVENSGKFVLLLDILEQTLLLGEKLLVFSQSLVTLDLVEEFLSMNEVPYRDHTTYFTKNTHYYRLDGSTTSSEREKLINQFNCITNPDACVFLLSTKAGCLGINLIGANRVVMLDASWNPCHDCQAVCRVYRYGQEKPCFIYRFVTDNTMERKIYDRQISKQGMADRVVDEIQVQNQNNKKENDQLLEYQEDKELPTIDTEGIEKKCFDPVLVQVIKKHATWITQSPFTHESLLIEQEDQRLTRLDKRLAKEAYEKERKCNVSFSRQSYANYYTNRTPQQAPMFRGPRLPSSSTPPVPHPALYRQPTPYHPMAPLPFSISSHSAPREIKPGVSLQMIQTGKEIVIPGPENFVVKKGEMVAVIQTPKGTYIKLGNGKIFAVRNKKDADMFGLTENQIPASSTAHNAQVNPNLANLLLQNRNPRHYAPNIVPRRHPVPNGASQPGDLGSQDNTMAPGVSGGIQVEHMDSSYDYPYPNTLNSHNADLHAITVPPLPAHLGAFGNYHPSRGDNSFHSLPNLSHMAHMSAPSLGFPVPNSQNWSSDQDQQELNLQTFPSSQLGEDASLHPHFSVDDNSS